MFRRGMRFSVVLAAIQLAGCASAANTVWLTPEEGGKRVYGGVRLDLETIATATDANSRDDWPGTHRLRDVTFFALDVPFSLVADTFTLPYTLIHDGAARPRRTTGTTNEPVPAGADTGEPIPDAPVAPQP